ncbi:hypothetical protein VH22019_00026 [Vibrio phage VH2_2019]|nr:hypothetical protein VH22019_00026 [Vibrio phage VH2_2019]
MGLKLGVLSGGNIYLNHNQITVETNNKRSGMTLTMEGLDIPLQQGYEVDIAEGVTIKYLGKSSGNVCRLEVTAPDEVCVAREEAYQTVTRSTGGYLISKSVYDWFRDWTGYTREEVWTIVHASVKVEGGLASSRFTFTVVDNIVTAVDFTGNNYELNHKI